MQDASGKWRFEGLAYLNCNNPGGDCYWEGRHPKIIPKNIPNRTGFNAVELKIHSKTGRWAKNAVGHDQASPRIAWIANALAPHKNEWKESEGEDGLNMFEPNKSVG